MEPTKPVVNKRFIIDVYLIPMLILLTGSIILIYMRKKYNLNNVDIAFGFLGLMIAGWGVNFNKRKNWILVGNGIYIHKNEITADAGESQTKVDVTDLVKYPHVFYTSLSSKISSVILGIITVIGGVYIWGNGWYFLPVLTMLGGGFLTYTGCKEFYQKAPKLKLSPKGLWTKELGFQSWSNIKHIEFKLEKNGRYAQRYLEIYMRGLDTSYPDQRLPINELINKEKIEPILSVYYRDSCKRLRI